MQHRCTAWHGAIRSHSEQRRFRASGSTCSARQILEEHTDFVLAAGQLVDVGTDSPQVGFAILISDTRKSGRIASRLETLLAQNPSPANS